ncbi:B-cell receptor CD22-like isoform X2 [Scophthalmus maximus]|uniref:B-cell receptor CD22-like isoform X2 n=1 Tax=Scophthalmus maximus TaxID=52904 RepID=UPI001FA93D1A|nr:B-cell receptor CD22-like isoform X2 [Scophthalmus maximus]
MHECGGRILLLWMVEAVDALRLKKDFVVSKPEKIESISESCVTVPCAFEVKGTQDFDFLSCLEHSAVWKKGSATGVDVAQGEIVGDIRKKNCTTIFNPFTETDKNFYFFRLQCPKVMYTYTSSILITPRTVPPPPLLTFVGQLPEGDQVRMQCSAPVSCSILPPSLTWSPRDSSRREESQMLKDEGGLITLESTMTFTASADHHNQKFSCSAIYPLSAGGNKTSIKTVTLSILYAPRFTNATLNTSGPVSERETVTFICLSDANPPVTNYTWFRYNGGELTRIGQGQMMLLVNPKDSGEYLCEAHSSRGSDTSKPVLLEVTTTTTTTTTTTQYAPRFTNATINTSGPVSEKETVTLTCLSDANPPVTNYTWFRYNSGELTRIGQGQTMLLVNPKESGEYLCEAHTSRGSDTSKPVLLEVTTTQYAPRFTNATIITSGPVSEKETVTLTCLSNANPPVTNYTWFRYNSGELTRIGQGQTMLLVNPKESGEYLCEAQTSRGSDTSKPVLLEVTITQYAPRFTNATINTSGPVSEKETVTFTCSSDANPPVTNYTWFRYNSGELTRIGQGQTMLLVNPKESGEYLCEAHTSRGSDTSKPVLLEVTITQYAPRFTNATINTSGPVSEKETVTFTCSSDANPPVTNYTWFRYNSGELTRIGQGQTMLLVNPKESGEYLCEAHTSRGSDTSKPVLLEVTTTQYAPRFTNATINTSGPVSEKETVTLTCLSDANPPVTNYTWFRYNSGELTRIGQGQTMLLVNPKESGEYLCEAHTSRGSDTSKPVLLEVTITQYAPRFTNATINTSGPVSEKETVTLTCWSDANPPVTNYTWFRYNSGELTRIGQGQTMLLVNPKESGEYLCEAHTSRGSDTSKPVLLEVTTTTTTTTTTTQYAPRFTNATINKSGPVSERETVTFTCSSDANPPVTNYTWFRYNSGKLTRIGQGQTMLLVNPNDSGEYLCKAQSSRGSDTSKPVLLEVTTTTTTTTSTTSTTTTTQPTGSSEGSVMIPYSICGAVLLLYVLTVAVDLYKYQSLSKRLLKIEQKGENTPDLQSSSVSSEYDQLQPKQSPSPEDPDFDSIAMETTVKNLAEPNQT